MIILSTDMIETIREHKLEKAVFLVPPHLYDAMTKCLRVREDKNNIVSPYYLVDLDTYFTKERLKEYGVGIELEADNILELLDGLHSPILGALRKLLGSIKGKLSIHVKHAEKEVVHRHLDTIAYMKTLSALLVKAEKTIESAPPKGIGYKPEALFISTPSLGITKEEVDAILRIFQQMPLQNNVPVNIILRIPDNYDVLGLIKYLEKKNVPVVIVLGLGNYLKERIYEGKKEYRLVPHHIGRYILIKELEKKLGNKPKQGIYEVADKLIDYITNGHKEEFNSWKYESASSRISTIRLDAMIEAIHHTRPTTLDEFPVHVIANYTPEKNIEKYTRLLASLGYDRKDIEYILADPTPPRIYTMKGFRKEYVKAYN